MNSLEEIKEHIYSTHTTRCQSYEAIAALDIKTERVKDICIPVSWAICVDNDFFYSSSDFKELKKFLHSFNYDLIIWTYWLGGLYYNLPQEIFGENPEINTGGNGKFFPKEIKTENRLIFRDSRELSKMTLEDMGAQLGFSSTVNSVAIICKWITLLKDLIGVEKVSQLPISQGKLYRTKVEFSEEFNKNGYIATLSQSQMRYQDGKGIWKDEKTYEKFHNGFRNGLITRDTNKDGKKIKNVLYADITSAFPAVMYTKKFPWSFTKINMVGAKDPSFFFSCYRHPVKERCFFGKFTFTNLSLKKEAPCATVVENTEFVTFAPVYSSYMTDIEYQIICKFYNFDSVVCEDMYKADLVELDKREKKIIYELFQEKQKAQGTPQYGFYKILLNAAFGNKCIKMARPNYDYHYDNRNYYYPEGIWIAAIQRKIMADIIWDLGDDFIYTNTDSVICHNTPKARKIIEDYNSTVEEEELGKFKMEEFKEFYMVGPSKYCLWKNNRERKIVFAGIHQTNGNLTPQDLESFVTVGFINIKDASILPRFFEGPFTFVLDGKEVTIEHCLYLEPRDLTFINKKGINNGKDS